MARRWHGSGWTVCGGGCTIRCGGATIQPPLPAVTASSATPAQQRQQRQQSTTGAGAWPAHLSARCALCFGSTPQPLRAAVHAPPKHPARLCPPHARRVRPAGVPGVQVHQAQGLPADYEGGRGPPRRSAMARAMGVMARQRWWTPRRRRACVVLRAHGSHVRGRSPARRRA